jgi:hypothetical protein
MAPAANKAATVLAGKTAPASPVPVLPWLASAGMATAGMPAHPAAAAAMPASGPATTIRSASWAAWVIAWTNRTGMATCRASRSAMSSSAVIS